MACETRPSSFVSAVYVYAHGVGSGMGDGMREKIRMSARQRSQQTLTGDSDLNSERTNLERGSLARPPVPGGLGNTT